MAQQYETVQSLAERWHCHPNTVYRGIREGIIPVYRLRGSGKILIPIDGLEVALTEKDA